MPGIGSIDICDSRRGHDQGFGWNLICCPTGGLIAAALQRILPDEPTLLYRALIIQSARWPGWMDGLAPEEQVSWMRSVGYGVPDVARATENTDKRVTLITEGTQVIKPLEAAIYTVEIPAELRSPGNEFDVRIEVTLSYSSKPRRTRGLTEGLPGGVARLDRVEER